MAKSIWNRLKHFSRSENWGDPDKMDPFFLLQLDRFRAEVNLPFHLSAPAYGTKGHSKDSFHYVGRAVDGRFINPTDKKPISLRSHFVLAMKSPFNGIGLYTWWPNGPGIHLDNRDGVNGRKIWVSRAPNQYEPLTVSFLEEMFKGEL